MVNVFFDARPWLDNLDDDDYDDDGRDSAYGDSLNDSSFDSSTAGSQYSDCGSNTYSSSSVGSEDSKCYMTDVGLDHGTNYVGCGRTAVQIGHRVNLKTAAESIESSPR